MEAGDWATPRDPGVGVLGLDTDVEEDDDEDDSGRRLTAAMGSIVGGCAACTVWAGPGPDGPF